MGTGTTVLTVMDQLVDGIEGLLSSSGLSGGPVPVYFTWPGPNTPPECVFLLPHPETADLRLDQSHENPTIKVGRQQSQEEYAVPVTIWTFRPDLVPSASRDCLSRAVTFRDAIDGWVRENARLGLDAGTIQQATPEDGSFTLFPFQAGWACEWRLNINVRARLT